MGVPTECHCCVSPPYDRWMAAAESPRLTAEVTAPAANSGWLSGVAIEARGSIRGGQPRSQGGPSRRPVFVRHGVLHGVPPASVEPHPMLAQHTLPDGAEALDGGLRASVVGVGVPDDADCA